MVTNQGGNTAAIPGDTKPTDVPVVGIIISQSQQPQNISPGYQQVKPSVLPAGVRATDIYPGHQESVTAKERDKAGDLRGTPRNAPPTGTLKRPSRSLVTSFELGDHVTIKENARATDLRGQTGVVTDLKFLAKGYVRVVVTGSNRALNLSVRSLSKNPS